MKTKLMTSTFAVALLANTFAFAMESETPELPARTPRTALKTAQVGTIAAQTQRLFLKGLFEKDPQTRYLADSLIPFAQRRLQSSGKQQHKTLSQDAADLYALFKHVVYSNAYAALPGEVLNLHSYESGLNVFDPLQVPMLAQAATAIQNRNLGLASDHAFQRLRAAATRMMIRQIDKDQYDKEPMFKSSITTENFSEEDHLPWKADRLYKGSMDKWKKKILTTEGSLVKNFALDSALFNPDLEISEEVYVKILSFKELLAQITPELRQSVSQGFREDGPQKAWGICGMQMKINFQLVGTQNPVEGRRVNPITQYVSQLKAGKAQDFSFAEKFGEESAAYTLFLQYVTAANAFYALTHDDKGNRTPELQSVDEALRDVFTPKYRVDQVFLEKALSAGEELVSKYPDFVKRNALAGWIFFDGPAPQQVKATESLAPQSGVSTDFNKESAENEISQSND
jgi:hypothetical protein